jgi:hypothetical protein
LVEFNPNEPGVDKVAIEGRPNGDEIHLTVHFASVASRDDAKQLATKVYTVALNRIAFHHGIVIEDVERSEHLSRIGPQPNLILNGLEININVGDVRPVVGRSVATIKSELEHVSPPGERYFGLLRSARLSSGPVEEFMHLYNILLMLFGDGQAAVDKFIVSQDPNGPQTPDPRPKYRSRKETVYTRLRNEFGHNRAGTDLESTKAEMANRLSELVDLTRRAIEQHP